MGNSLNVNPLVLDTASAVITAVRTMVTSIIVIASADNWHVILKDASGGNVVYEASSAIVGHRSVYWNPCDAQPFAGIYTDTLTNITRVLVYTKAIEIA